MIGGHYIAYCLVDPDRMFDDGSVTTAEPEAIEGTEDGDQSPITSKPPVMPAASNERKASGSSTRSDLGGGIKRPSFFGKSSSTSTAQLPQGKKDKRVWCYCSEYVYSQRTDALTDSTSIRLASLDEVLKARAYLCFVSPPRPRVLADNRSTKRFRRNKTNIASWQSTLKSVVAHMHLISI